MNKKNSHIKIILRIIGFSLIIIGLILTVIAFVNFGNFDSNLFMLNFIGLPCVGIGIGITFFSFSQSIARFIKSEHAPVINEYAKDISPAITSYTSAIKDGLADNNTKVCECGAKNPTDAKFCNECGAKFD